MTKSTSAGLRSHLDLTVTNLTTLWRIIRVDGVEFSFTDHDVDIPYDDGDGLKIYKADTGYNRTAVANNVGLSVDNMDVVGLFDDVAIKEDELRAGLFDFAEIKVYLVNWDDLTQGDLKVRRGKIGEVVVTPQGYFRTELRGLTQQLSQLIIQSYQPECRVDLGGVDCAVPINPDVLGRLQVLTLDQTFRVPTFTGPDIITPIISNPGFEAADTPGEPATLTGWTITSGDWRLVSGTFNGLAPDEGTQYLMGGNNAAGQITQAVTLVDLGISLTAVDAGDFTSDFSIRRANSDADDLGRVLVQFTDENDLPTGTLLDTGDETILPLDAWVTRSATGILVPSGTRKIIITLIHTRITSTQSNSAYDNILFSLIDSSPPTTQKLYENRTYRVTVAGTTALSQPTYDTTVGNPTVDGTATLVPEESFMREAIIIEAVDLLNVIIAVTETRAVDDWYDGGALIVETGPNAGIVREIKNWTQAASTVQLFITEPFSLQTGIRVKVYPGCDKRRATCRDRFANVINFRGEPDIPGKDALVRLPDAS